MAACEVSDSEFIDFPKWRQEGDMILNDDWYTLSGYVRDAKITVFPNFCYQKHFSTFLIIWRYQQ